MKILLNCTVLISTVEKQTVADSSLLFYGLYSYVLDNSFSHSQANRNVNLQ